MFVRGSEEHHSEARMPTATANQTLVSEKPRNVVSKLASGLRSCTAIANQTLVIFMLNLQPDIFNKELERARECFVIVEGKKDKVALQNLGFQNIFIIHETGKSIYEKIEEIENISGKKKICILTDFDKKGKQLYLLIKSELSKMNVRLDNSFRGLLLKMKVSHVEGMARMKE